MTRKKTEKRHKKPAPRERRKLSEVIWEYAGDFIGMGDTLDERQSLLNAACSAWNIACNSADIRNRYVNRYIKEYRRYNRDADEEDVQGVTGNIEKLIEKKLELFPADARLIVGARIIESGDKRRIEVVSAKVG